MALASDLMGLGVAPLQAARTANGGIGPVNIAAAGSSRTTATQLGCSQYFTQITGGSTSLTLPPVGGDNGALFADDFVICNNSGATVTLFANTGASIVGAGAGFATFLALANNTVYQIWALSTTQWLYK